MYGILIAPIILLVLLAVSFFYVKARIIIQLENEESTMVLRFEIRPLLKNLRKIFKYGFPIINKILPHTNFSNSEDKNCNKQKKSVSISINQNLELLGDYYKILKVSLGYLVIEKLEWETVIGTNDAMYTAVISGYLWAFKGSFVSILSSASNLKKINLDVQSDFKSDTCWSRMHCILKVRVVHIIFIATYLIVLKVRRYLSGYTGRKAEPSYRGSNENCHAEY